MFQKKLKGELFTKTENEYFSRSRKKKATVTVETLLEIIKKT